MNTLMVYYIHWKLLDWMKSMTYRHQLTLTILAMKHLCSFQQVVFYLLILSWTGVGCLNMLLNSSPLLAQKKNSLVALAVFLKSNNVPKLSNSVKKKKGGCYFCYHNQNPLKFSKVCWITEQKQLKV